MRRRNAHPEHDAQVALFQWAKLMEPKHPELALLFSVPNGMRTSIRTAVKAKAEGLKRGVPDVWLPVKSYYLRPDWDDECYRGLTIEMKAPKGTTSPEQKRWMAALRDYGWRCEVCYSTQEAIDVILNYLGAT
jgi:hypothetical protein